MRDERRGTRDEGTSAYISLDQPVNVVGPATSGIVSGGPVTAAAYQLNDGTVSADLYGTGGVTKDTAGTVLLAGDNFYAGPTVVEDGTLIVASPGGLPAGTGLIIGDGNFTFDASHATPIAPPLGVAAGSVTSAPIAAVGAPAAATVVASTVSALSPAIATPGGTLTPSTSEDKTPTRSVSEGNMLTRSASEGNPAGTPRECAPATTTVHDAVQPVSVAAGPLSTHFRSDAPPRTASVSVAGDAPSLPAPAAMSGVRVDAVFTSHRSAFDRSVAPGKNLQSAGPWGWLAAAETSWNSPDQNQKTDSTVAALDAVLARFGV